jgi:hypothetical protein
MKLQEFIKKYLPDYMNRIVKYRSSFNDKPIGYTMKMDNDWHEEHFPEALQAFTDKICEEQRKNCSVAMYMQEYKAGHSCDTTSIKNAKQPEIE